MILPQSTKFTTLRDRFKKNASSSVTARLEFSSTGHYRTLHGTRYILHVKVYIYIHTFFTRESVINDPQCDYDCVKMPVDETEKKKEREREIVYRSCIVGEQLIRIRVSNVSRKAASVWIPLRNAIEDKCMYWVCRRECTLRILLAFVGELIVLIEILISVDSVNQRWISLKRKKSRDGFDN